MTIPIIISTPDALFLPQDAYFYFPLTRKNYWCFWAIELYAVIFGSLSVCAYAVFYTGSILRLELQFDILASRLKETLEVEGYEYEKSIENQEIHPLNDMIVHHQTIYK